MKKAYSYIRFSSEKQRGNDSLRRQTEDTEKYAKANNLQLDDSLRMHDLAKSGFRGEHVAEGGALYDFLQAIREKRVEPGSILLVESIDRLSRQKVSIAFEQFLSIIRAGVSITTMMDGMTYTPDSIDENIGQLYVSLGNMVRAYQESLTKSVRIGAAYKAKKDRALAGIEKITKRCPAWLELREDRRGYDIIPEMAEAIRRIYQMRLEGKSLIQIAQILNTDPILPKRPVTKRNPSGGWQSSYVEKILQSRTVIGEAQLNSVVWNEARRQYDRIPYGDPIPNYYPAVVDPDVFYQAQANKAENLKKRGHGGGRVGKTNNLFTHIARCGLCGGFMHAEGTTPNKIGSKYFYCEKSHRQLNCTARSVNYREFEKLFFENLEELNVAELMPDAKQTKRRSREIDNLITATEHQIKEQEQLAATLTDSIQPSDDRRIVDLIKGKLLVVLDKADELRNRLEALKSERQSLQIAAKEMQRNVDTAKEVYQLMASAQSPEELSDIRQRLKREIAKMVSQIDIYPLVEPYQEMSDEGGGLYKWMDSKTMRKIRIKFHGSKNVRLLILSGYGEAL
jgi:DNA invertase Pin-like site-specific DNA recombinase